MIESKPTLQQTTQLIVDILNFESSDAALKHQLTNKVVDWDAVVIISSKHLVLPAVYCRLHEKELLQTLPKDLIVYLEELTRLNRERNLTLLREAKHISKLFNAHQIDHTFIKGIALLAGNYFKDPGERMIGDIDILVAPEDLDTAFELLVSEGYSKFIAFSYEVKNFRHRPRQISEDHIGAIELHGQLLQHHYNHLIDNNSFLEDKVIVNEVAIPNSHDLIRNTILAQQINDKAYYYNSIKLKGIYDVLAVGLSQNKALIKELSLQKFSLGFLNLASIFCPTLKPTNDAIWMSFYKKAFLFSLKVPTFGKLLFKVKAINIGFTERVTLFLFNRSYRIHVIRNKFIK